MLDSRKAQDYNENECHSNKTFDPSMMSFIREQMQYNLDDLERRCIPCIEPLKRVTEPPCQPRNHSDLSLEPASYAFFIVRSH